MNGFSNNVGFLQSTGIIGGSATTNIGTSFENLTSNGVELIVDKTFKLSVNRERKDSLEIETSLGGTYQISSDVSLEAEGHNVAFSPQTLGVGKLVIRYKNLSLGVVVNYVGAMRSLTSEGVQEGSEDYARLSLNARVKDLGEFLPMFDGFLHQCKSG